MWGGTTNAKGLLKKPNGNWEVECPNIILCLEVWSTGSGTVRKCGLVGVDALLLKELGH
jgi:hypothetical protein